MLSVASTQAALAAPAPSALLRLILALFLLRLKWRGRFEFSSATPMCICKAPLVAGPAFASGSKKSVLLNRYHRVFLIQDDEILKVSASNTKKRDAVRRIDLH